MERIREKLDTCIEIYKGGIFTWSKDQMFLEDCAYYEGRIKKLSELLNVPAYSYMSEIPEEVSIYYNYGYNLD